MIGRYDVLNKAISIFFLIFFFDGISWKGGIWKIGDFNIENYLFYLYRRNKYIF